MAGNTLAFVGDDDGGRGIFVRTNGVISPVIRVGDYLYGSTISDLTFTRDGFDRSGTQNLAFSYQLEDGRRGIVLALHIPEPATAIGAVAAAFCILCRHRHRRYLRLIAVSLRVFGLPVPRYAEWHEQ